MTNLADFLSRITVSFTFTFWDVIGLMVIFFSFWTFYFGTRLYAAYAANNSAATFESWIRSAVGRIFFKFFIFPLIPIFFLIGVIAFPLVAVWQIIVTWLERRAN